MMHSKRVYRVVNKCCGVALDTPATLARILTEHDWCTCNGFRIGHLVFLNDSTGPDGAQEYAVFDERSGRQIESLTVSWMTAEELTATIERLLAGGGCEPYASMPSLNHPEGSCYACA